jgi:ABC-type spermidine/putrescine transport system permease subunit II
MMILALTLVSLDRDRSMLTWPMFSSTSFYQIFQDFPSHRIFERMYEALNIDKK